jgi:hypothetical protein
MVPTASDVLRMRNVDPVAPSAARSTNRIHVMRNVDQTARGHTRSTFGPRTGRRPRIGEQLTGR